MMEPIQIKVCEEEYEAVRIAYTENQRYRNQDLKTVYAEYRFHRYIVPDAAIENLEWQGVFALIEVEGKMVQVYKGKDNSLIECEPEIIHKEIYD